MKKAYIWSIFILIVLAAGCAQKSPVLPSPPVPTPTSEASSVFTLNGKVYQYDYLNATSDITKPLAGATVTTTATLSAVTTTSATGSYSFEALPIGQYTISVSKESYRWHGKASNSTSYNFSSAYYIGTTQEVNFALDPRPVFLGSSFSDYAELPVAQTNLKLYFSKPMNTGTVTAFLKYLALRTADVSGLSLPSSAVVWEDGNKTISLTAATTYTADALYQAGVACSNASFGIEGMRSADDHPIYGTKTGDSDLYNSSTDATYGTYVYVPFKTIPATTTAPGQPTNLTINSITTGSPEVDYDSVYKGSTGGIRLQFNSVTGSNGYRLYASRDNITYTFVKEFSSPSLTVYVSDIVGVLGNSCAMGYDTTGYPVEPGLPWPFLGSGTYLKVSAYNSWGEGPRSDAKLVVDTLPPTVTTTAIRESSTVKVIKFSEPMDLQVVKNKNTYTMTLLPAIATIEAINDYGYIYTPYQASYVRIYLVSADDSGTITVSPEAKDITGNKLRSAVSVTVSP
jgi:hypothetical protein